ncbi:NAD-dependent malic enzyme [Fluviispira multicolorata]|uniref:Malolactic enzyme n=1 Tax=Fluviispira multicolorata TaxID=2654512 RepID=A0A833JE54_9BACT|nr:NAD-dependent malic enzyme [Fluviispira multicolorata]KAB8029230.1 oxaloacetate-decarboxylating malate dehydrogenase [Fluviispira multicolorata]
MFKEKRNSFDGQKYYEVSLKGKQLLLNSYLNKDTAFTYDERIEFKLDGLIPNVIETLDEQVVRVYGQYLKKESDIERNIFLTQLYDRNETLFFRLMQEHLIEMVPVFYTPTVGEVVQQFNQNFRRPRGLFISYPQMSQIEDILSNIPNAYDVSAVCVTDSEAILGIGDQGVGGIVISIAKLAMYTLCAGFHPTKVLPIVLDVGTNNKELLQNPLYLGWRHERIRGEQYDDFIDAFVTALRKRYPHVYLHWEDFGRQTARRNLDRYKNEMCTFNDDMQGTAAVTVGAILAGLKVNGTKMSEQTVVIHGAGTAGCCIADQILAAMIADGLTEQQALAKIFLIDMNGMLHSSMDHLEYFQRKYAQPVDVYNDWERVKGKPILLYDVVKNVKPTILIGTSTQTGAFSEEIVKMMASHCERPIIFPLSNPTSRCEALPANLIEWTQGKVLVATGSPFADVRYNGKVFPIGQCNNAFVFPGLGLGVVASKATRVNDEMLVACAKVISECAQINKDPNLSLLPSLTHIRDVSYKIAYATVKAAQDTGVAPKMTEQEIHDNIHANIWKTSYVRYVLGKN